jgi:2-iminobutanoate/2-iminopropanoate deaminase
MAHAIHDIGVARQIGTYSDAIEIAHGARWLMTAGTPGLAHDGSVPAAFVEQAELAWGHIVAMLVRARMSVHDLVKINQYFVRATDIATYAPVRERFLCGARPASTLLVVPALVRPGLLLEIEAVAAGK